MLSSQRACRFVLTAAEVTDNDPKQQEFTGVLALQLHSGPPMTVQFRDVRVKKL